MKREILITIGIILLFLGVGVQPAFAGVSNTSVSDSEEDCDICPKVSKQHIVRIKSLINRLKTLENKLLLVSKDNLKLTELYKELSEKVTILDKELNSITPDNEKICDILTLITFPIGFLFNLIILLIQRNYCHPIRAFIYLMISIPIDAMMVFMMLLLFEYECIDFPHS